MRTAPAPDPGHAHGVAPGSAWSPLGTPRWTPSPVRTSRASPARRHDPRTPTRPTVPSTLASPPRVAASAARGPQPLRRAHLSRGADTAGLPSDSRHHPEGERQMITSRTGESAPGAAR